MPLCDRASVSIFEGRSVFGAIPVTLISKNNLKVDLVLNVRSILTPQILRQSKDEQNY
ncbi:hypothetical protein Osc7112_5758 [Oscillatoria nigro-viridis PCC 7112]|uniref:Uncharacterized protein n=1 Tax=Phormidium nigroviride PCC 7112 TaxID=179408 RepID=K9VQZ2_9CYAN|nr:hypothetical protein Osc7112_5758 [Oscillatoria nigro-viridis PCC 7112]